MIIAMEQARWPEGRVAMLGRFWAALQLHPYKQSCDALDARVLLHYQVGQRKLWHLVIPTSKGAWHINIIDGAALKRTRDRVYHADRVRADAERDAWVSRTSYVALRPTLHPANECLLLCLPTLTHVHHASYNRAPMETGSDMLLPTTKQPPYKVTARRHMLTTARGTPVTGTRSLLQLKAER